MSGGNLSAAAAAGSILLGALAASTGGDSLSFSIESVVSRALSPASPQLGALRFAAPGDPGGSLGLAGGWTALTAARGGALVGAADDVTWLSAAGELIVAASGDPAAVNVGAADVVPAFAPVSAIAFALTAAQVSSGFGDGLEARMRAYLSGTAPATAFAGVGYCVLLDRTYASNSSVGRLPGSITGLLPGTSYTLYVAAADRAQLSFSAASVSLATQVDVALSNLTVPTVLRTYATFRSAALDPDSRTRSALALYPSAVPLSASDVWAASNAYAAQLAASWLLARAWALTSVPAQDSWGAAPLASDLTPGEGASASKGLRVGLSYSGTPGSVSAASNQWAVLPSVGRLLRAPDFALSATVTREGAAGAATVGSSNGPIIRVADTSASAALCVRLGARDFVVSAGGQELLRYDHDLLSGGTAASNAIAFRLTGEDRRAAGGAAALRLQWTAVASNAAAYAGNDWFAGAAPVASNLVAGLFWDSAGGGAADWAGLALGGAARVDPASGAWSAAGEEPPNVLDCGPGCRVWVRDLAADPLGWRAPLWATSPSLRLARHVDLQPSASWQRLDWTASNLGPGSNYGAVAVAVDGVTEAWTTKSAGFTTLPLPSVAAAQTSIGYDRLTATLTVSSTAALFSDSLTYALIPAACNAQVWLADPAGHPFLGANQTVAAYTSGASVAASTTYTGLAAGAGFSVAWEMKSAEPLAREPPSYARGVQAGLATRGRPSLAATDMQVSYFNLRARITLTAATVCKLYVVISTVNNSEAAVIADVARGNSTFIVGQSQFTTGQQVSLDYSYQAANSDARLIPGTAYKLYVVAVEFNITGVPLSDVTTSSVTAFTSQALPTVESFNVQSDQDAATGTFFGRVDMTTSSVVTHQAHVWIQPVTLVNGLPSFGAGDFDPSKALSAAFEGLTSSQRISAAGGATYTPPGLTVAGVVSQAGKPDAVAWDTLPLEESKNLAPRYYAAVYVVTTDLGQGYGLTDRYVLGSGFYPFKSINLPDLFVVVRELGTGSATYDVILKDADTGYGIRYGIFENAPSQEQLTNFFTWGSTTAGVINAEINNSCLGAATTDINTYTGGTSKSVVGLKSHQLYTVAVLLSDSATALTYVNSFITTFRTFHQPTVSLSALRELDSYLTFDVDASDAFTSYSGGSGADSAGSAIFYQTVAAGASIDTPEQIIASSTSTRVNSSGTMGAARVRSFSRAGLVSPSTGSLPPGTPFKLAVAVESYATHSYRMPNPADLVLSAPVVVPCKFSALATATGRLRTPAALALEAGSAAAVTADPLGVRNTDIPYAVRLVDPDMTRAGESAALAVELHAGEVTVTQYIAGGLLASLGFSYPGAAAIPGGSTSRRHRFETVLAGAAAGGPSNYYAVQAAPGAGALAENSLYTLIAASSEQQTGALHFASRLLRTRALPRVSLTRTLLARRAVGYRVDVDITDSDASRCNAYDLSLTVQQTFGSGGGLSAGSGWITPGSTSAADNASGALIPVLNLQAASNATFSNDYSIGAVANAGALQPSTTYEVVYKLHDRFLNADVSGTAAFTTRADIDVSIRKVITGSAETTYHVEASMRDATVNGNSFNVRTKAVLTSSLFSASLSNSLYIANLFGNDGNGNNNGDGLLVSLPQQVQTLVYDGTFDGLATSTQYTVFAMATDNSPPYDVAYAFYTDSTSSTAPKLTYRHYTSSDSIITLNFEYVDIDSPNTLHYWLYSVGDAPTGFATEDDVAKHVGLAHSRELQKEQNSVYLSVTFVNLLPGTTYVAALLTVDTSGNLAYLIREVQTLSRQAFLAEAEYADGLWELSWRSTAMYQRTVQGPVVSNGKLALVPSLERIGLDRAYLAGDFQFSPFGGYTNNVVEAFDACGFAFVAPSCDLDTAPVAVRRVTLNMRSCVVRAEAEVTGVPAASGGVTAEYIPLRDAPFCFTTSLRFADSNAAALLAAGGVVGGGSNAAAALLFHEMRAPAAGGLVSPAFDSTVVFQSPSGGPGKPTWTAATSNQAAGTFNGKTVVLFTGSARVLNDTATVACACAYLFDDGVTARHMGHNHYRALDRAYNAFLIERTVHAAAAGAGVTAVCAQASSHDFDRPLDEAMRIVLTAVTQRGYAPVASVVGLTGAANPLTRRMRDRHAQAWEELWSRGVTVESRSSTLDGIQAVESIRRSLRLAAFNLYGSVRDTPGVDVDPAAAEGVDYDGTMLWNREMWVLPALLYLRPAAARDMLLRRHAELGKARSLATSQGRRGAAFPYSPEIAGLNRAPYWDVGSCKYIFNSALVAVGTWDYFRVTQDRDWLLLKGYGILSSVAEFLTSAVSYSNVVVPTSPSSSRTVEMASFGEVLDLNGETALDPCFTVHTAHLALAGAIEASFTLRYNTPLSWQRAYRATLNLFDAEAVLPDSPVTASVLRYSADSGLAAGGFKLLEPLLVLNSHYKGFLTDVARLPKDDLYHNLRHYASRVAPEYVSHGTNRLLKINLLAQLSRYMDGTPSQLFDVEDVGAEVAAALYAAKFDIWGALSGVPAATADTADTAGAAIAGQVFNDVGMSAQLLVLFISGFAGARVQGGYNSSSTTYQTLGISAPAVTARFPKAWKHVEYSGGADVFVDLAGGVLINTGLLVSNLTPDA